MNPVPEDANPPCRGQADVMFPVGKVGTDSRRPAIARAKAVCLTGQGGAPCPWLTECRAYSLRWLVQGVWGATDEDDRRVLRDRLGIVPEPLTFGLSRKLVDPPPHGTPARYKRHLRAGERCQVCLEGYRRRQNPKGTGGAHWRAS